MNRLLTRRPSFKSTLLMVLIAGVLALLGLFALGPAAQALAAPAHASAALASAPQAEPQPQADSVDDFEFLSWTSHWQVGIETTPGGKDRSYAEVTETIVPVFPEHNQNRGIIRTVPLAIGDGRMEASNVDVRDEAGNKVEFESGIYNGALKVEIGDDDYVHGEQTYVLTYTLRDVIADLGNPEVQELYVNLLPTSREQPIETFSAQVTLSPELAEVVVGDASCYIGEVGSSDSCEIFIDGLTYQVNPGAMAPNETLTVDIGFEPGTVPDLSLLDRIGWFPFVIAVIPPIGVILSIIFLVLQWRHSRHPRSGIIVAQYEPRPDLPPQIAGQVMPSIALHAFPASILNAAVKGALRIEESMYGPEQSVPGSSEKLRAPELRKLDGSAPLHPVEQRFVDEVLFADAGGGPVSLTSNEAIGKAYTDFSVDARNSASEAGFLAKSPAAKTWKNRTIWVAIASLFVAIAAFIVLIIVNGGALVWLLAGILAALIVVLILSAIQPTKLRTAAGAEAFDHLQGLREYVKLSEADRIQALQAAETADRVYGPDGEARIVQVYEQLLPYAVMFGLDRSWAKELQAHYEAANASPLWMHGYRSAMFTSVLSNVKHSANAVLPTAEGGGAASSGFGGGGFAGGGAGGGSVGGR